MLSAAPRVAGDAGVGGRGSPNGGPGLTGGAAGCGFRFLPNDLSNPSGLRGEIGRSGWPGSVVSASGSTTVGVTTTTNSVVEWFIFLDLKRYPRIGMLA